MATTHGAGENRRRNVIDAEFASIIYMTRWWICQRIEAEGNLDTDVEACKRSKKDVDM